MTEPATNPKKGRYQRMLLPVVMRYSLLRRGLGIQVVYRNTGGGLIVGGLAYAALFALVPTFALVIAGLYVLIDDPQVREDAVELVNRAFPAFESITAPAAENGKDVAAATVLGEARPEAAATAHLLELEQERAARERDAAQELERREAAGTAKDSGETD